MKGEMKGKEMRKKETGMKRGTKIRVKGRGKMKGREMRKKKTGMKRGRKNQSEMEGKRDKERRENSKGISMKRHEEEDKK